MPRDDTQDLWLRMIDSHERQAERTIAALTEATSRLATVSVDQQALGALERRLTLTEERLATVQRIVYGAVGVSLLAVLGALLSLVLIR